MTPEPIQPPTPPPAPKVEWWQTLVTTIVGAAVSGLLNHYLGPMGGIAGAGVSVAYAHRMLPGR